MLCCAGVVEGVLWYFPFENGSETMPQDEAPAAYGTGAGAFSQAQPHYHHELATQLSLHNAATKATQVRVNARRLGGVRAAGGAPACC